MMNRMIKKLTALVLTVALACPMISMATPAITYAAEIGDVNESGTVDASDALLVLQHVVKITTLSDSTLAVADADADGTVSANDALEILSYAVKLIPCFKGTVDSPEEALQIITNHVKNCGMTNEGSDIRFIYEWYYDESDPDCYVEWIPEVDYDPASGELAFYLGANYAMSSDNLNCFDNVKMIINTNTANIEYYVFLTDLEGETLHYEALFSTDADIASLTPDTIFYPTTDYSSDASLDADWMETTNSAIHFALVEWDALLQEHFNMTLQDLGFTSYN